MLEDAPHAVVQALHHRGIDGISMMQAGAEFRFKVSDIIRLRLDWRVRCMMSQVEKKRLPVRPVDDAQRLGGEAVGEVFAGLAELQVRDIAELGPEPSAAAVGPEERLGSAPLRAADVHIKAMGLGVVLGIAQVPFPDQRGEVAGIVQSPRQRRLRVRQIMQ